MATLVYFVLLNCLLVKHIYATQEPQQLLSHEKSLTTLTNDHQQLLDFHANLTRIPSITGNEHDVGVYLESYLRDELNFTVERLYVPPLTSNAEPGLDSSTQNGENKKRFNVFAYHGNNPRRPRTLLSSHVDTVPPFIPYTYSKGDKGHSDTFSGRGSVDAKASVAAQVFALRGLIETGKVDPLDVAVLYVVGEERSGDGMKAASKLFDHRGYTQWRSIIFGEPTEQNLVCGHKGISVFEIRAHGKSAHSGYPWLGVSANTLLIRALAAVEDVAARKGVDQGGLPYSDKFGWTTVNIGRMEGGVAPNVVPAEAYAQVTLRLADGTPADSIDILEKAIHDATKEQLEKGGKLELQRSTQGYAPVNTDCDIGGFKQTTVNYGTDVPNFTVRGHYKRYLYGPGTILVAHSDHETGTVDELLEGVDGLQKLILHSLVPK